jgi:hypothetical protein
MVSPSQAVVELLVPDTMLRLLAAGVRFLAMTVAETGVDAEGNVRARRALAELVDHVGRAAIDRDAKLDDGVESFAIENISRIDDLGMVICQRSGLEAGLQGAVDFAGANGIDDNAMLPGQTEDGDV